RVGAAREAPAPALDRAQRPAGRLRAERLPAALAPLLDLPGGPPLPPGGRDAEPLSYGWKPENAKSLSFCRWWQPKHWAVASVTSRSVWLSPLKASKPQPPVALKRARSFSMTPRS